MLSFLNRKPKPAPQPEQSNVPAVVVPAKPSKGYLNTAKIYAVFGGRGSGKSTWIRHFLRREKPKRLVVYDPMGDYGDYGTEYSSIADVIRATNGGKGNFKVIFRPSDTGTEKAALAEFERVCQFVYLAGNLTFIVEELQSVTSPSRAGRQWSNVTLRGRHKNISVIGASQRPASVDKNFYSNADLVVVGRLNYEGDVKTMASVLCLEPILIRMLLRDTAVPPKWGQQIERDMVAGITKTTKIYFK